MPGVPSRRRLVILEGRASEDEAALSRLPLPSPRIFRGEDGRIIVYDLEDDAADPAAEMLSPFAGACVAMGTLDAQAERPATTGAGRRNLAVLSNAPEAIEEVFSRMSKNADIVAIMKLPGALSARRYTLRPLIGRDNREMLTFCEFEAKEGFDPVEGLADCLGEPDTLVMERAPGDDEVGILGG